MTARIVARALRVPAACTLAAYAIHELLAAQLAQRDVIGALLSGSFASVALVAAPLVLARAYLYLVAPSWLGWALASAALRIWAAHHDRADRT